MSKQQKSSEKDESESVNSKKFLSRKTKKDGSSILEESKDNQSIPDDEIKCSICLEYEKFSKRCHKCIKCLSYFHMNCYNLFNFMEDNPFLVTNENVNHFTCQRCNEEIRIEHQINQKHQINCEICYSHYGIIKKRVENKFIHSYCYVFYKDQLNNIKKGKCQVCSKRTIPVIKCESPGCKTKYHLQCALQKKIIFSLQMYKDESGEIKEETFKDKIPFYCEIHVKPKIDNYNEYKTVMAQSLNEQIEKKESNIETTNQNIIKDENNEVSKSENNPNKGGDLNNQKNEANDEMNKTNVNSVISQEKNSEINKIEKESHNEKENNLENNISIKDVDNSEKNKNEKIEKNIIDLSKKAESNKIVEEINEEISEKMDEKESIDSNNKIDISIGEDINEEIVINKDPLKDYVIPEVIYEDIDLFDDFSKLNEDFCFPGCFSKIRNS